MARRRAVVQAAEQAAALTQFNKGLDDFWEQSKAAIGARPPMLVDTCAILACFHPRDEIFKDFLENQTSGFSLFTSSFVVAEASRRLVKPRQFDPFIGENDEKSTNLAIHIIEQWLASRKILVLAVPMEVYHAARPIFIQYKFVRGWDFVDASSVALLRGVGGQFIMSGDRGFIEAHLQLAPSDAYSKYITGKWWEFYD